MVLWQHLINVLLASMVVFVRLSMHGAINVNYFKLKKEELREYIGNVFFILFTNFVLIFINVFFLKTYISNMIKFPVKWISIVIVIALCQSIFTINLRLWQVEQKSLPYGLFQISRTILNVILSLIFIVALVWGWQGRLLGVITSIVFGFLSIFVIHK
jgi:hypothetical protein